MKSFFTYFNSSEQFDEFRITTYSEFLGLEILYTSVCHNIHKETFYCRASYLSIRYIKIGMAFWHLIWPLGKVNWGKNCATNTLKLLDLCCNYFHDFWTSRSKLAISNPMNDYWPCCLFSNSLFELSASWLKIGNYVSRNR